jgi:C-terminal peptidase prc
MIRLQKLFLPVAVLVTLACNAVGRTGATQTPTATQPPAATATATETPTPELTYVPADCLGTPIVTAPAPTDAAPSSFLATDVPITTEVQLRVFDDMVATIEDVYFDPNLNGIDWAGLIASTRASVEAGMDTETFYLALDDFVAALGDEHSQHESPEEVKAADEELSGRIDYVGVGILVTMLDSGHGTILLTFPDSPAEHGGLRAHDRLLAVDGEPFEDRSDFLKVRGPACTQVNLTVQSPGEAPRTVALVRHAITSVLPVDPRWVPTEDGSRIGYIFLPTVFDETIPDTVAEALDAFGPLDGLILDNRMNGGGSSSVVEPLLGYFTDGTLGHFVSREGRRSFAVRAEPIHNSQEVPLVVLVGPETVSFGEIMTGILRDIGRAKVVGTTTLGNVETLHGYTFEDGSRLWIAEETFDSLNSDDNWEATGIQVDVEAGGEWDEFTFETDPAVAQALALLLLPAGP